ncbi:hypothetical protein MNBD_ALPHA11-340, partial [hydrothermal vent metagenome]
TDEIGFNSALDLAYEMGRFRLIEKVNEGLRKFEPEEDSKDSIMDGQKKPDGKKPDGKNPGTKSDKINKTEQSA